MPRGYSHLLLLYSDFSTTYFDFYRAELNLMMTAMEIGPGSAVLHLALRFDEGKIVLNSYLVNKFITSFFQLTHSKTQKIEDQNCPSLNYTHLSSSCSQ